MVRSHTHAVGPGRAEPSCFLTLFSPSFFSTSFFHLLFSPTYTDDVHRRDDVHCRDDVHRRGGHRRGGVYTAATYTAATYTAATFDAAPTYATFTATNPIRKDLNTSGAECPELSLVELEFQA